MRKCSVLAFVLLIASCGPVREEQAGGSKYTDPGAAMLDGFYRYYLNAAFEHDADRAQLNDSLVKYVARDFLARIDNDSELDEDPFVHAQDYMDGWRQGLHVRTDSTVSNRYKVFLWPADDDGNPAHAVWVRLVQEGGAWKIAEVTDR